MTRAIGDLVIVDTAADDHVELAIDQSLDHPAGTRRVICRVAVDEHIDIGINVGKHPPDHVPLALQRLRSHHGARSSRFGCGRIRGVVVVDKNSRVRQAAGEIAHHGTNRLRFVETRNDYADFLHNAKIDSPG